MGRVLRLAAVAMLGVLVLVPMGWVFYSRAAFGTWDPTAQPNRISYCDRTYYPGAHRSRAQIDAEGNGLGVFPFRQVGASTSGVGIYAKPLPDSVRHKYPNAAPLPCAMTVYLSAGLDDYVAYALSGGP